MPDFDVIRLFTTVFSPRPGEKVTVLVDLPHGALQDDDAWADRRQMAEEWRHALAEAAGQLGLTVHPLVSYLATGQSNGPLPEGAWREAQPVKLLDVLADTDIALALTRYSATAPLMTLGKRMRLRGASMPGVSRRMQDTALAADYQQVAQKCQILVARLRRATGAQVTFSTGDMLYLDLRYREPHADDGQCPPGAAHPFINLPSGEAYIAPYEGERPGEPSRTAGVIPAQHDGALLRFQVRENRVVDVLGDAAVAGEMRRFFALDEARRNIAELGLGCNDRAVVSGNVLEDEKAGFHWAFGRSEHLGGTVGPEAFRDPAHIVHHDLVYAPGNPLGVAQLVLDYDDGSREEIMRDSRYTIF